MPLKLSLKPGEAVIVNGAVLRNGDRRGTMVVENQARVLREKDVLPADAVKTPAQRAYFVLMQMYLLGEQEGELYDQAMAALCDIAAQDHSPETKASVLTMARQCAAGDVYGALSKCRKLMQSQPVERMQAQVQTEIRPHG